MEMAPVKPSTEMQSSRTSPACTTTVRFIAAPSPERPPLSVTFGGSPATSPRASSLPFTFSPSLSTNACLRSGVVRRCASSLPSAVASWASDSRAEVETMCDRSSQSAVATTVSS